MRINLIIVGSKKDHWMRICGVEISGSEARIAIIEKNGESYTCVASHPKKVDLNNDESSDHVRSFMEVFQSLVRDQRIDHLGIKKRQKKGEYAAGPTSFKIEVILQLLDGCEVHLVAPATIAAVLRKQEVEKPASLLRYQEAAFDTAVTLLYKLENG